MKEKRKNFKKGDKVKAYGMGYFSEPDHYDPVFGDVSFSIEGIVFDVDKESIGVIDTNNFHKIYFNKKQVELIEEHNFSKEQVGEFIDVMIDFHNVLSFSEDGLEKELYKKLDRILKKNGLMND